MNNNTFSVSLTLMSFNAIQFQNSIAFVKLEFTGDREMKKADFILGQRGSQGPKGFFYFLVFI